ncbi:hypothetical protein [Frankia sp. CcI49]|uniref:hypothetical protein n=1 Tax=Frankia sp. CcI49 TaxID=1745382 RepID=UPI00105495E7|nr:hypothetical protein [Frankia sp. CcI49]
MTDEREIIECTKWITELHRVRSQRWWRSLPSQDVQEHIAAWRAQRTPAAPSVPPWCGECGDGEPAARTNLRFRRAEGAPCPRCHPDALQESA